MQANITKWGNSLGIRIPSNFAKQLGLSEGSGVEIRIDDKHIIIEKPSISLDQLLAQITPENLHEEIDLGPAVGREQW